jgi:hypothetical protein
MQQESAPEATPPLSPRPQAATTPAPAAQLQGVPTTVEELWGLRERQSELGSQLSSVASRRGSLAEQLEDADDPVVRAGLQERIAGLDQRILQLESDLAEAGRQLTATPAAILGSTESRPPSDWDAADVVAIAGGTLIMTVAALVVFRFVRRIFRGPPPARPALAESAQRLERMEQALDAVAIEVERISEGQRFVTRLLSEGSRLPSLTGGRRELEPVHTPER